MRGSASPDSAAPDATTLASGVPPHAAAYGDACAAFYDDLYPTPSRALVETLVRLAGDGVVLDAGCGTGRILLALDARGVRADGVDSSTAMLAAARAKRGSDGRDVHHGDIATWSPSRCYTLVTCLVDTLALLPDASTQARAIANLGGVLVPGGTLLIESARSTVIDPAVACDGVMIQSRVGLRRYRAPRCPTPLASLDAWAEAAGLRLASRWRDWRRVDDDGTSPLPISCFRRDA